MLEEQPKDKKILESITAQDLVAPSKAPARTDLTQPEVVNIVEKISKILTPYFIVVVGLYLYDDNFLIGLLLVAIGIAALLQASTKNASSLWESAKQFLGFNQ
jgi:cadmium resistance protein CadD (predicted permease)